ncbi:MAG: lysophospholipid acyltransferase family protein [Woeseia sp.]
MTEILRRLIVVLYGLYAWFAFIVCVLGAILSALFLPGLARRRQWVSRFARLPFLLAGIRTTVRGGERLPVQQCIVVANHASYLDGVILKAYLPPSFSYVIKGEMQAVPLVGFVLRRIGSRFVDRNTPAGSSRDARTLLRAADSGESLAFFPEGTFVRKPGLGAFRLGAFAAAIKGDLPVVPVVIRGARNILPAGTLLPRRHRLQIDILDPLEAPPGAKSRDLAEMARQRILSLLGEPDLVEVAANGCHASRDTGE